MGSSIPFLQYFMQDDAQFFDLTGFREKPAEAEIPVIRHYGIIGITAEHDRPDARVDRAKPTVCFPSA